MAFGELLPLGGVQSPGGNSSLAQTHMTAERHLSRVL